MQLKVAAVAKSKSGFMTGDKKWFNADRNSGVNFESLKKGDLLEVELNEGGYVTKLSVVGSAPASSGPSSGGSSSGSEKDAQIARSTAVKAVFGSPVLADHLHAKDLSEASSDLKSLAQQVAAFILTGEFTPKSA